MSQASRPTISRATQGLSAEEVARSRERHGTNVLTPAKRTPWWRLYLEKYDDPVIRLLLIAAALAAGVGAIEGDMVDGVGIIIAVVLATTLAFLNEFKARRAFDILNEVSDEIPATVVRDGVYRAIPRKEVVVGDVVLLEPGEEVVADARVLEARSLLVDESRLTGESVPVAKRPSSALGGADVPGGEVETSGSVARREESAYPADKVFRGTLVAEGTGIVEVMAVGDATEMGVTARAASEDTGEATPLDRQLARLSQAIGVAAFGVAAVIFLALLVRGIATRELLMSPPQWYVAGLCMAGAGVALVRVWGPIVYDGLDVMGRPRAMPRWLEGRGMAVWAIALVLGAAVVLLGLGAAVGAGWLPLRPHAWISADAAHEFLRFFMISVTIIVVAVPEGLAMSVTLSLAYSMRRMARANNLVRRLHACETIGAATVICCDKTGTLTENRMRVFELSTLCKGAGTLSPDLPPNVARLLMEALAVNGTAQVSRLPGQEATVTGNPTEGALLLWLDENGVDYQEIRSRFRVDRQWPFNTERKFMGTLGRGAGDGQPVLHVKGAPEILLERCSTVLTPGGVERIDRFLPEITSALLSYQRRGMRTLGFACKTVPDAPAGDDDDDDDDLDTLAREGTWLGFAALTDPVRAEVPEAIRACRRAGIDVKVVTGDNPDTAREVARQVGLWDDGDGAAQLMGGREFEQLSDEEAMERLPGLRVLARARPMDKMRTVRLLQRMNHVVAVTGDGTNDAPALNRADVGLAMGKTGTAVAREAADIILLDDSFQSIVSAVTWGRSLYENIQRFIQFQLTINVAACLTALLGPFLGVKFPFTVTQMLWVNLIMDTLAALALATEPPHAEVMNRLPRDPNAFIITRGMARHIFGTGALFLMIMVGLLLVIRQDGTTDVELSVFFTVFVLLQFWNLFNARGLGRTRSSLSRVWDNRWFLLVALLIFLGQVVIVQFGGVLLRTVPLRGWMWALIVAGTSPVLWIGEWARWRARRTTAIP